MPPVLLFLPSLNRRHLCQRTPLATLHPILQHSLHTLHILVTSQCIPAHVPNIDTDSALVHKALELSARFQRSTVDVSSLLVPLQPFSQLRGLPLLVIFQLFSDEV